jgi:hypothetical protein
MSEKMVAYANDDGRLWDTFNLVTVLKSHLEHVFVKRMTTSPSVFEAKSILTKLHQMVEGRNWRAHMRHLTESEVVDTLSCTSTVLRDCGLDTAASEMEQLQADVKALVHRARTSPGQIELVELRTVDRDAVVLYQVCCGQSRRFRFLIREGGRSNHVADRTRMLQVCGMAERTFWISCFPSLLPF